MNLSKLLAKWYIYGQLMHLKYVPDVILQFFSYMTAMGALNLKIDAKTKQRFRQVQGGQNPDHHRRRTIDIALADNRDNIVQRILNTRTRRGGGGSSRRRNNNQEVLDNGRVLCRVCNKDYAKSSIRR